LGRVTSGEAQKVESSRLKSRYFWLYYLAGLLISSGFIKRQELANVAWSETRGSLFVGRLGGHCDEFSRSLGLMPTLIDVMLQFDVVGRKSIVSRYKDP
jgi:hypothetical protein